MKATQKQWSSPYRARTREATVWLGLGTAVLGLALGSEAMSSCYIDDDDTGSPAGGTGGTGGTGGDGVGGMDGAGGAGGDGGILPTNCSGNGCNITTLAARLTCNGPDCNNGPENGLGIYVVAKGNYCFNDGEVGSFCPETFVNISPSGLRLRLREPGALLTTREASLAGRLVPPGGGPAQPVDLVRMRADQSKLELGIKGTTDPTDHIASDDELDRLEVLVSVTLGESPYPLALLRWKPAGAPGPDGLLHYEPSYRSVNSTPNDWVPLCVADTGQPRSVFLGGITVDGLTAEVGDDASATTMACETGAIDACMVWGYTPWNPKANSKVASNYLFGTCLQAKRAAYFIGHGDPETYTQSGTEIFLRDPFGIQTYEVDPLEALWSPRGAECLNPEHLRRPELRGVLTIPPDVPRCDVPPRWGVFGKIAIRPGLLL
jgi:ADYC domain-containing protein